MSFIDEITTETELLNVDFEPWAHVAEKIYYYPMTLNDNEWIEKQSKGSDAKSIAFTLIRKCCDESGERLFKPVDRVKLMSSFNTKVLNQLVIAMFGGDDDDTAEDKGDLVKN